MGHDVAPDQLHGVWAACVQHAGDAETHQLGHRIDDGDVDELAGRMDEREYSGGGWTAGWRALGVAGESGEDLRGFEEIAMELDVSVAREHALELGDDEGDNVEGDLFFFVWIQLLDSW